MAADQERADRIRALKQDRPDLTWRRIADAVGVTERSATDWQKKGGIDYDNAKKLAEVFEVEVDYIWRGPTADERAPSPFAGQDALADRLDAIMENLAAINKRLDAMSERQSRIEDMINDGLGQLAQALSSSAVEQADRIVQGIVADVQSGKLTVPPPRSKPRATKRAPKRTRAA